MSRHFHRSPLWNLRSLPVYLGTPTCARETSCTVSPSLEGSAFHGRGQVFSIRKEHLRRSASAQNPRWGFVTPACSFLPLGSRRLLVNNSPTWVDSQPCPCPSWPGVSEGDRLPHTLRAVSPGSPVTQLCCSYTTAQAPSYPGSWGRCAWCVGRDCGCQKPLAPHKAVVLGKDHLRSLGKDIP